MRHRVVQDIRVSIETLGICGVWYNGISRDHSVYIRVVVPRVHVNQIQTISALWEFGGVIMA